MTQEAEITKGDLLFFGALPELILGLIGIPVAFALQELGKRHTEHFPFFELWQPMLFIFCFYGLYSIALILIFEVVARWIRENRILATAWDECLAWMFPIFSIITMFVVAALIGISVPRHPEQEQLMFSCLVCLIAAYTSAVWIKNEVLDALVFVAKEYPKLTWMYGIVNVLFIVGAIIMILTKCAAWLPLLG